MAYLFKSFEIESSICVDVFGLVAKDFTSEIVEEVGEGTRDGELLEILACH